MGREGRHFDQAAGTMGDEVTVVLLPFTRAADEIYYVIAGASRKMPQVRMSVTTKLLGPTNGT